MNAGIKRRAGPLFGAGLVAFAVLATFTPVVPPVSATDPTPDPSATALAASPTDSPTPTAAPESPTPAPAPTPTVDPSPSVDPSASPSDTPSVTPDPSPSPSPDPSTSPSDLPSASPSAGPSDSPSPSPSSGPASPAGAPPAGLSAFVNPSSPHIIHGLTSDTCDACHGSHHAPDPDLLSSVYRVSPLHLSGEAYKAADFALCWRCHSSTQVAIEDTTGTAPGTNFPSHGFHLREIGAFGTGGTDITVPGAGEGNALCAECHDNLHGTAADSRGLVKFAPDVQAYGGLPIAYDTTTGTCTLTCHGVGHDGAVVPAP
jgi:hypothetical protein